MQITRQQGRFGYHYGMPDWERSLLKNIHEQLAKMPTGGGVFSQGRFHLAILIEPYLSLILNGRKTIESRFCRRKWMPYGMVQIGDTLILKRSCGPVVGLCKVAEVFYYDLSDISLDDVRQRFGSAIAATEAFWNYQQQAQFVSLFRISHVTRLPDIPCHKGKGDRRAWVVMNHAATKSPSRSNPIHAAREMIRKQFTNFV